MFVDDLISESVIERPLKAALMALKPYVVQKVQWEYDNWGGSYGLCNDVAKVMANCIKYDIFGVKTSIIDKDNDHYWVRAWMGKECYDIDIPFGKYERWSEKREQFFKVSNVIFTPRDIFIYKSSKMFLKAPWEARKRYNPMNVKKFFMRESPDFGYSQFNNRDKDIKKIKFVVEREPPNAPGFEINIQNDPWTKIRCFSFGNNDVIEVTRIQITREWQGTGVGQILYDKAIQLSKKMGYHYFESGFFRTSDAESAWDRLRQRYSVEKVPNKKGPANALKTVYRIDLTKIPLKESPDFGYSRFNDRDKELSSVKFNIRSGPKNVDHQSFIIEAINENNEIGKMVLSFIFSSSSMNVLRSEIVKEWKGTGLGQMLYDKAIDLAKSKGCREFRSDTTRSYDADQAWEKLRKRYPVRYRDSHTYIPHSYFYIVLSRIKVAESPDFGYRHYNDRDAEISKLTWKVKSDENGIEIRAIDKNNISGFSEGVIIARPMKSDSCGDISCIELNGIQITTSKLTERGNWHNTGLGQMLYDRMIHEAKKAGYSYIVSDFTRSLYAKSAWEKLAKRYSVKKLKDSDGDSYFRIDLQGK